MVNEDAESESAYSDGDSSEDVQDFLSAYSGDQDEDLDMHEKLLQKQIIKHFFANNRLKNNSFRFREGNRLTR